MLCYGFLNEPVVFLCFYILLSDLGDMGGGGEQGVILYTVYPTY